MPVALHWDLIPSMQKGKIVTLATFCCGGQWQLRTWKHFALRENPACSSTPGGVHAKYLGPCLFYCILHLVSGNHICTWQQSTGSYGQGSRQYSLQGQSVTLGGWDLAPTAPACCSPCTGLMGGRETSGERVLACASYTEADRLSLSGGG